MPTENENNEYVWLNHHGGREIRAAEQQRLDNSGSSKLISFVIVLVIVGWFVAGVIQTLNAFFMSFFMSFEFTASYANYYTYASFALLLIFALGLMGLILYISDWFLDPERGRKYVVQATLAYINYLCFIFAFSRIDEYYAYGFAASIFILVIFKTRIFFAVLLPSLMVLNFLFNWGLINSINQFFMEYLPQL
ncbi:hypothetical protein J5X92_15775 [Alteromonas sp. K632G]|jgi:hypothetical protein|uniref:hypothetical protein n=1 Tax=Alteromonas sp. K632G TaxID=2820757 RepID=UPI001AD609F9|nr:hypothetical protein [Alteromonas sp. K632G]MBO7923666.1 hypothetical protein [Alteromonas sp. K632G]